MRLRLLAAASVAGALALTSAACGSGSGSDSNTIKVAYERSTDFGNRIMDNYLAGVKKQFEKANPGKKIQLIPIQATENGYYTKVDLMMRSPRTAPDIVYEDTFLINSDIKAGYLRPIDSYLKNWKDWDQYFDTAKKAASAQDGHTYGVPYGTDTRGIWYNKNVFAKAGLPADWQPKSWADLLTAARAIKSRVPSVTPMYLDTGKATASTTAVVGRPSPRAPGGRRRWRPGRTPRGGPAMPTQNGQAPGKTSLSGGWTWALTAKGKNPDLSFKFIETLQNKANATK